MTPAEKMLSSVAGSTCAKDYPGIVPLLRRVLSAYEGRSAATAARNRAKGEATRATRRAAILAAVRTTARPYPRMPAEELARLLRKYLKQSIRYALHGLDSPPSKAEMLEAVRTMHAEDAARGDSAPS